MFTTRAPQLELSSTEIAGALSQQISTENMVTALNVQVNITLYVSDKSN